MEKLFANRYILQERLGQGGMGVVYRALDRLTGKAVALKQIIQVETPVLPGIGTPNKWENQLRVVLANEFQMLAGLRHPHIISVLDYGFTQQRLPYFTMDLLENVRTIVAAGRDQPLSVQIEYLLQLLEALVYLHRREVLHRDLKPSNVLVADGGVRVLDFGLAAPLGAAFGAKGTVQYIDPAVMQSSQAEATSDLYTVGVLAYELWSGQLPFGSDDLNGILYCDPDMSVVQAPPGLVNVVEILLRKNPEKRFADAQAVIAALRDAAGLPPKQEDSQIRESFLRAAPFVGREQELEQLKNALKNTFANQGSTWLVGGESGVGKSRLLDELRIQALVMGALVVRGQCTESPGYPYQLWRDPLRMLALRVELDDLEAGVLKTIIPDLPALLGREFWDAPRLEGKAAQQRLILNVINMISRAAERKQPILLLLEDLQWAIESLEPLRWLNRSITELPVMVVGTYRNDDAPALPADLPAMNVLSLNRMDVEMIGNLSAAILGDSGRDPQLVELLKQETEGNAFFLVETVRALAEEAGGLSAVGQKPLPDTVISGGVQQVLQRRIDRVVPVDRAMLQLAAMAGRVLDLKLLAAAMPEVDLESWLLRCAGVAVLEIRDEQWRFAHNKLIEWINGHLDHLERSALHTRLAKAIERIHLGDSTYIQMLAEHWYYAGDPEKAAFYARLAGLQATEQFAASEALYFFNRALDLIPPDQVDGQYQIYLSREYVYDLLGRREQQKNDLEKLAELADQLVDDPQSRVQVTLRYAYFYEKVADYRAALRSVQESINLAEQRRFPSLAAAGLVQLGRLQWRQGSYKAARQTLQQAVNSVRALGLVDLEAEALRNLGNAYMYQNQVAQAAAYFTQSQELCAAAGNQMGQGLALNNLGYLSLAQGDYDQARGHLEQALHIYRQINEPIGNALVLHNLSEVYRFLGDADAVFKHTQEALQIRRTVQDVRGEAASLNQISIVNYDLGNFVEGYEYAKQALQTAVTAGDVQNQGYALDNLGHSLLALKRFPEALEQFRQAADLRQELGQTALLEESLAGIAQAHLEMGNLIDAVQAVDQVLEMLPENPLVDLVLDPLRVYLSCYRVLRTAGDGRASGLLEKAYRFLAERAERIQDPASKKMFLENRLSHRMVVGLWHANQG